MYEDLKTLQKSMTEDVNLFAAGDIVTWKPGLKNKRAAGPFIVVDVYSEPVYSTQEDSGSAYFKEPLDLVLGHIDNDGDFVCYHYDSRRMKLV